MRSTFEYPRFRCACCGKERDMNSMEWGWKYDGKCCCSYTCMRELERKETKKPRKPRKPPEKPHKLLGEDKDRATKMILDGVRYQTIADTFHVHCSTVSRLARELGIVRRPHRPHGRRLP